MPNSILIMDSDAMTRALRRIAHEILEHNPDPGTFALIGIPSRGVELARRLADLIKTTDGRKPESGAIDISMHRDDLSLRNRIISVQETHLPLRLEEFTLILVDDVLYTGRTTRAALDALFSHGRPRRVQLCVLIDRGHRELPVEASFIGRNVQTTMNEVIEVKLTEVDDAEKVLLMER